MSAAEQAPVTSVSVILPCYNEAGNIPAMHERLARVATDLGGTWEFIFVDDHSGDDTPRVLAELAFKDPRVKSLRFSRNFGSHAALAAGLAHCKGDTAFMLAADGQDPPELVGRMLEEQARGQRVVWAIRSARRDSAPVRLLSQLYWRLMRLVAMPNTPPQGADMLLIDRTVIDVVNALSEKNTSIFGLILWAGFEQGFVEYEKGERLSGHSKWTFAKKLKLAIDSFVSFSYTPIRLISLLGLAISSLGMLYACLVTIRAIFRWQTPTGWSSLMIVMLVTSGIQMLMLGTLGEYLWRTFDESRRRPRYIVTDRLNLEDDAR